MESLLAELAKQSIALAALVAFLIYLTKVLIPKLLETFRNEQSRERELCREGFQLLVVELKELKKIMLKMALKPRGRIKR